MGPFALTCALGAAGALALPGIGKLVAVGLGLFATVAGALAFRRRQGGARGRLLGACAVTVGLAALALGGLEVGLTLATLQRLADLV